MTGPEPEIIGITSETIRLGQLLKLAGVVGSGAEGKMLLAEGSVVVNGEVELRRGRQLQPGDRVSVMGEDLIVAATPAG